MVYALPPLAREFLPLESSLVTHNLTVTWVPNVIGGKLALSPRRHDLIYVF